MTGIVDLPLPTKSTSENAYRPTELFKSESYNDCCSYAYTYNEILRTLNSGYIWNKTETKQFCFSFITVRLHVMQRTVLLSEFCPSVVRPSVRQMRVLWQN